MSQKQARLHWNARAAQCVRAPAAVLLSCSDVWELPWPKEPCTLDGPCLTSTQGDPPSLLPTHSMLPRPQSLGNQSRCARRDVSVPYMGSCLQMRQDRNA